MKLASRMRIGLGSSALAMFVIGAIGMERTFASYGRIDAPIFAIYALMSLFFVGLSIGMAIQAVNIKKIIVVRRLSKPKVPKSTVTVTKDGAKKLNYWVESNKMWSPGKFTQMELSYEIKEKPNGSNGIGGNQGSGKDD
jgi:hypothetical protein